MSYNPTTQVQDFASFQWPTISFPNPRLAAPIDATTTTLTFTAPPLDHAGAVITLAFLMGIRNSTGYVETVYVPANAMSSDGFTATGVTRGIYLEGLDFTTGNTTLASPADQSATVFCNISGILQAINQSALSAGIGANIKFNGRPLWMGSGIASVPVFATTTARDAAITAPSNGDSCYVTATGLFYDYAGGAWGARASGVATPNGSTTVAGKWQGATVAQQGTATDTGSTGAELIPLNKNLISVSAGAGDVSKIPILNSSGILDQTFLPTVIPEVNIPTLFDMAGNNILAVGGVILLNSKKTAVLGNIGGGGTGFWMMSRPQINMAFMKPTVATITPTIDPFCYTKDGSTEYLLAAAAGGTTVYRYSATGGTETSCTFSGTAPGAIRRMGYDPVQGYVYIQDGSNKNATTIKRYTFSGSVLTNINSDVTLGTAPNQNGGSGLMYVGSTYLIIDDNAAKNYIKLRRYGKNSGTQVDYTNLGYGDATNQGQCAPKLFGVSSDTNSFYCFLVGLNVGGSILTPFEVILLSENY